MYVCVQVVSHTTDVCMIVYSIASVTLDGFELFVCNSVECSVRRSI